MNPTVYTREYVGDLFSMPFDILRVVCEYLYSGDVRRLLHTCKFFTTHYKQHLMFYNFNKFYSLKYLNDKKFRDQVNNSLSDPPGRHIAAMHNASNISVRIRDVLGAAAEFLNLVKHFQSHIDVTSSLGTFLLKGAGDVNARFGLGSICDGIVERYANEVNRKNITKDLKLRHCFTFRRLSDFKYVESIDMSYARDLNDINCGPNLKRLKISHCKNISDVSCLSNLISLDISGCTQVKDVSMLGNLQELDVSYCYQISDVSALGRVRILKLAKCINVLDISALGGQSQLSVAGCKGIQDFSMLGSVKVLDLSETNIRDIGHLQGVEELVVDGCHSLSEYPLLESLRKLKLVYSKSYALSLQLSASMTRSTSISTSSSSSIAGMSSGLSPSSCLDLTEVGSRDLEVLDLSTSDSMSLLCCLERLLLGGECRVGHLKLMNVDVLSDEHMHYFSGLRSLSLSSCQNITDVSALSRLHSLDLSGCVGVTDVSMLGNVYDLDISYNDEIRDVSELKNVYRLNISACSRISDVSGCVNVRYLTASHCEKLRRLGELRHLRKLRTDDASRLLDVVELERLNPYFEVVIVETDMSIYD